MRSQYPDVPIWAAADGDCNERWDHRIRVPHSWRPAVTIPTDVLTGRRQALLARVFGRFNAMRNLEMRLRLDRAEWRLYPLARPGRWLACWDKWRPEGKGLLVSGIRELGWDEARLMIGMVGSMDDAAFQSWHAQTLATLAESVDAAPAGKKRALPPCGSQADL
jgi:hypothetical protein